MLRSKPTVQFGIITVELVHMLDTLQYLSSNPLVPEEGLLITSGTEGSHLPNSKHYKGKALDVRSKSFKAADKFAFRNLLQDLLGPNYKVLLENFGKVNEHFHIQAK